LTDLGTRKFYLLSAIVSLLTYAPYLVLRPPARSELLPAFGLACLMAVTFGVTTEAIRRGPLGAVSPITALSPAVTAALAVAFLDERLSVPAYFGIAFALAGIVLLSLGKREGKGQPAWQWLAVVSLALQGVGALVAKIVVTPAGPSALLLMSSLVQVIVGLFLAPPWRWEQRELLRRSAVYTVVAYAAAGIATIGYLSALAAGPAAVVVPLVATSPALAGILGIALLHESASRRQVLGICLAVAGAVFLASTG
jgi:uncharacterized membrane protein